MTVELLELLALGTSFVLSSFYSGSEAALVSIPTRRVKQLIAEGGRKAKYFRFTIEKGNEVLTTILIGNNLVNIFAASLTTKITQRHFADDALAVSVGVTTILILVFGEIIPKTFARNHAEQIAWPMILVLRVNYYFFYPAVKVFSWIINQVLGKNATLSAPPITKGDIEFMVNEAEKVKTIDSKQLDLLSSILEFPNIKVKDILIPRTKVTYITKEFSFSDLVKTFKKFNHSRYPVCDDDLDNPTGLLHVKDLVFLNSQARKNFEIEKYLNPLIFVYEHMKIQAVFDYMNKKKVHLALVKDENGLVVGIITLEDIIEEILGDIVDEHDDEELGRENLKPSGVLVDGHISLRDLYNEYDIKIPLNDNYSTLSGFLLDRMGNNFPKKGMMVFWEKLSFKIEKVSNQDIRKVFISYVDGRSALYSKKDVS